MLPGQFAERHKILFLFAALKLRYKVVVVVQIGCFGSDYQVAASRLDSTDMPEQLLSVRQRIAIEKCCLDATHSKLAWRRFPFHHWLFLAGISV